MITKFRSPFFDVFDTMFELEKGLDYPKTKIEKTEKEYKVLVSVPGLSKDDLKIVVKEGILKISYEKEPTFFVGKFTRSYTLPDDVNENDIQGKVVNGILELTLPISKKKTLEKLISLN